MHEEKLFNAEGKRITLIGFIINVILAVIKIITGFIGKSSALMADGLHSMSDFVIDIMVLMSIKFSNKPPDECHNYGHGKYQTIVTVIISIVLFIVALEILKNGVECIRQIIGGASINMPEKYVLYVSAFAILIKEFLFRFTKSVGRKTKNSSILANAWHHRADALASFGIFLGVLGAIILGSKWVILDPIASIIVSLLIFRVAYQILKPSLEQLTEKSVEDNIRQEIIEIISRVDQVKGYHKLKTRKLGSDIVLDVHILVDNSMNIENAHKVADHLESEIRLNLGGGTIITIHIEPYITENVCAKLRHLH